MPKAKKPAARVLQVHARLFSEDIDDLKKIAEARGTPWQLELRLLVHRALKGVKQGVQILLVDEIVSGEKP